MSRLIDGLNELEKSADELAKADPLSKLAKLPVFLRWLMALLSAMVHEQERQKIFMANLGKERGDGKD